jgi:hypothetical protein
VHCAVDRERVSVVFVYQVHEDLVVVDRVCVTDVGSHVEPWSSCTAVADAWS